MEVPRDCLYTGHAREQMTRREVSERAVEYVLGHYDTRHPAVPRVNAKPAEIYSGLYEGRRLRVYIEIGSDPPRVKTVAWVD
jgi:Domain of unknown function (DUF4258)